MCKCCAADEMIRTWIAAAELDTLALGVIRKCDEPSGEWARCLLPQAVQMSATANLLRGGTMSATVHPVGQIIDSLSASPTDRPAAGCA